MSSPWSIDALAGFSFDDANFFFKRFGYVEDFNKWYDSLSSENRSVFCKIAEKQFHTAISKGSDPVRVYSAAAVRVHALCGLCFFGTNKFRVASDLCTAFRLTQFEDTPLELPFGAFLIEVTGEIECLVHKYKIAEGEEYVSLNISSKGKTQYAGVPFNRFAEKDLELVDGSMVDNVAATISRRNDARVLVRGLCSFLSAKFEPLEEENSGRQARLARMGKRTPKVFTVGRTIKLSRELRDIANHHQGPPLWKLQHRYIVRGHWRWQPIGTQLPDGHEGPRNAKKIWIQPHWKGPEGAEAWRHIYEVDADAVALTINS